MTLIKKKKNWGTLLHGLQFSAWIKSLKIIMLGWEFLDQPESSLHVLPNPEVKLT